MSRLDLDLVGWWIQPTNGGSRKRISYFESAGYNDLITHATIYRDLNDQKLDEAKILERGQLATSILFTGIIFENDMELLEQTKLFDLERVVRSLRKARDIYASARTPEDDIGVYRGQPTPFGIPGLDRTALMDRIMDPQSSFWTKLEQFEKPNPGSNK